MKKNIGLKELSRLIAEGVVDKRRFRKTDEPLTTEAVAVDFDVAPKSLRECFIQMSDEDLGEVMGLLPRIRVMMSTFDITNMVPDIANTSTVQKRIISDYPHLSVFERVDPATGAGTVVFTTSFEQFQRYLGDPDLADRLWVMTPTRAPRGDWICLK